MGLAAVLFAGVTAIRAGAQAPSRGAQQVGTTNLLDDPLAKFAELMPDVVHPRCQNCHGVVDPFTGANHSADTIDQQEASRILDAFGDHNFALGLEKEFNKACRGCHDEDGAELWGLAPKFKSFVGKTAHDICSLWETTKHDSKEELLKHFNTDPLAALAFMGSPGIKGVREPAPPLDKDAFLDLANKWLAGQDEIPCAGWEGTTTQTERVNLTTNHSTVMGEISESTTETQDATRTITITVGGTGNFRIAVQGTERINTTVVATSGGQRCESIQRLARVYGTENGETLGKPTTATLEFRPGGAYSVTLTGPDERTVRVERTSGTLCAGRLAEPTTDTLPTKHDGWTVSFDGVLPNPADRSVLKDSKTKTVTEGDAWLTGSANAVTPLQTRDNGDLLPVPVEVTTTWDLRRREE